MREKMSYFTQRCIAGLTANLPICRWRQPPRLGPGALGVFVEMQRSPDSIGAAMGGWIMVQY